MSTKAPFDSPDVALMQALKFSSKDLDANRDGILTEEQRRRVRRWQHTWSVLLWVAIGCFAYPPISFYRVPSPGRSLQEAPIMGIWVSAVLLLIGAAFWFQRRTLHALALGKVDSTYGMINRVKSVKGICSIVVSGKRFVVSEDVYQAVCDQKNYTLYYLAGADLPDVDYLLSAEHHPTPAIAEAHKLPNNRYGKGH